MKIELGDVFEFVGGGTPDKSNLSYWNGDIPWASVKDIKSQFLERTIDFISEEGVKNSATNIAEISDVILITRISPGKTSICKIRTSINQDLKIVKPKAPFSAFFIYYLFCYLEPQITKLSSGTTVLGITLNNIYSLPFFLPPLAEQHRIVAKIEELFSELDKGIESLKTAQQQLKVYRQAVLKYAFEGRLTNPDLKEGELPEGWCLTKIDSLGRIETGTTPSKTNAMFYFDGRIPFYKPTDLEAGCNVNSSREYVSELGKAKARYLPAGSILITCIGATIGKTGLLTKGGIFNQQINAIVPNCEYLPKFVYYQAISPLCQEKIKQNASATTLPILNKGKFSELEMMKCGRNDQEKVVQEVESRLSVCDKIKESIEQGLQQAEALRQSILKKAFEGKLVPQDPNDEPASVLLERIRAEREMSASANKVRGKGEAVPKRRKKEVID